MCAKLGELFELAKRKALTANIFLGGEAFCNLLVKEIFRRVGCRNSNKHSLPRIPIAIGILPASLLGNYRTQTAVICYEF